MHCPSSTAISDIWRISLQSWAAKREAAPLTYHESRGPPGRVDSPQRELERDACQQFSAKGEFRTHRNLVQFRRSMIMTALGSSSAVPFALKSRIGGRGVVTGTLIGLQRPRQDGSGSCRCGCSPGVKCLASEDAKRPTRCQVALGVEGVVDGGGMNSQEALS
jgi:hypothetical protein